MADNLAFTYIWRIKISDLSALRKLHNGISSKFFVVDSFGETPLRLVLYPNGRHGSDRFDILLCACVNNDFDKVEYELSFLGPSKCVSHVVPKASTTFFFPHQLIDKCPTQEEVFVTKRSLFLPQNILTLQLKLWKTAGVVGKAGQCWSFTEITSREYKRFFNIKEYYNIQLEQDKMIMGSTHICIFSPHADSSDLMMNIRLKGETRRKAAVDITVTPNIPNSHFPLSCKLSCTEISIPGRCQEDSVSSVSDDWAGKWEFKKFCTGKEIIYRKFRGNCLVLSCCMVVLEIYDKETANNDPEFCIDESPSNPEKTVAWSAGEAATPTLLQVDLLPLYKEKTFCDFELRAGDASFPVHGVILAARSPVFHATFTTEMRGATSGVLDIPDVDADTLEKMLEYIYTDTVPVLRKDNAAKLYYAADKYLLPTLKQKCTSYLRTNIDLSNVCEILELAHRHSDEELKSAAFQFLMQSVDETVRSPVWKEFMAQNLQLAAEVMHTLLTKVEMKK